MVKTATQVQTILGGLQNYLDRHYTTIPYKGVSCGILASYPGFPVWTEVADMGHGVWVGSIENNNKGVFLNTAAGWVQRDGTVLGTNPMSQTARENVRDIAVCPHNPAIVIAVTTDGVWRTTDQGYTWSQLTMPNNGQYRFIGFDTEQPGVVVISGPELGSYPNPDPRAARSTDYGATWSTIYLPIPDGAVYTYLPGKVALHAGKGIMTCDEGNTYIGSYYWRTADAGASWTLGKWGEGVFGDLCSIYERVAVKHGTDDFIVSFAQDLGANDQDQAVTTDGGVTWSHSTAGPSASNEWGAQMAYNAKTGRLFGVSLGGDLYYSDNFGTSWTQRAGIEGVSSLTVDQSTGIVFISKTSDMYGQRPTGVYESADNGATWTRLGTVPYRGYAIAPAYSHYGGNFTATRRALGQWFGESVNDPTTYPTGAPHSVVSEQPAAPTWVRPDTIGTSADVWDLGLEGSDGEEFTAPAAVAERSYDENNDTITYKLSEHPNQPIDTPDKVALYIGASQVASDIRTLDPDDWEATVTKTVNTALRSLDYPPRHSFHLGKMYETAVNDTTKAGAFQNSIEKTDWYRDIYDPLFAGLSLQATTENPLDDYYFFQQEKAYRDTLIPMLGDKTDLPQGVAADGIYAYPYESKLNAMIASRRLAAFPFVVYTAGTAYARMLWAMHMLQRYRSLDYQWPDPALSFNPFGNEISVRGVADQAIDEWLKTKNVRKMEVRINHSPTGGVYRLVHGGNETADIAYNASASTVQTALRALSGLSGVTVASTGTSPNFTHTITFTSDQSAVLGVKNWLSSTSQIRPPRADCIWSCVGCPPPTQIPIVAPPDPNKANNFINGVFLAFMTVMGYGHGLDKYKPYADAAAERICNTVWGNTDAGYTYGSGWVRDEQGNRAEIYRPHHQGGTLIQYELNPNNPTGPFVTPPLEGFSKIIEEFSPYEFRFPLWDASGDWGEAAFASVFGIRRQKRQEPNLAPTNMESSAVCFLSLRLFLKYKYGPSYVTTNGLQMFGPMVFGKVIDENGDPMEDAIVLWSESTAETPPDLSPDPKALTDYTGLAKTDNEGRYSFSIKNISSEVYVIVWIYRTDANNRAYKRLGWVADDTVVEAPTLQLLRNV